MITSAASSASRYLLTILACLLILPQSFSREVTAAEYKASFLYKLSDFSGFKPLNSARLSLDPVKQEIYAIGVGTVHIFNNSGMEVYRFEQDQTIGTYSDIVFTSDRKMVVLAANGPRVRLAVCNFRGEPTGEIKLTGFPPDFENFAPNRVIARNGKLFLASYNGMRVAVTDEKGAFLRGYDLVKTFELTEQQRVDTGLGGFAVDRDEVMYFSIPALANVFILRPDDTTAAFGKRGSTAGRFGVNTGVAVDNDGNILVTDKLRSTVMVFDKKFTFVTEFGRRGFGPGDFIVPDAILVDDSGKVYVSNMRKRGVVVYQLSRL